MPKPKPLTRSAWKNGYMPTSPHAATDPARLPACSSSRPRTRSWTRSQPRSRSGPEANAARR
jgi:hypothetical protein